MKKQTILLWIGGVVGVLTMGALRFVGKSTDIFGLLADRREEVLPIFKSWITGTRG